MGVHIALVSWIVASGYSGSIGGNEIALVAGTNGAGECGQWILIECKREDGAIVKYQGGVDLAIMRKELSDRIRKEEHKGKDGKLTADDLRPCLVRTIQVNDWLAALGVMATACGLLLVVPAGWPAPVSHEYFGVWKV